MEPLRTTKNQTLTNTTSGQTLHCATELNVLYTDVTKQLLLFDTQ